MTHVTAAAADHNSSYALMTVRPIMLWIQICAVLYPVVCSELVGSCVTIKEIMRQSICFHAAFIVSRQPT